MHTPGPDRDFLDFAEVGRPRNTKRRWRLRLPTSRARWALAGAGALVLAGSPFAVAAGTGDPLIGGQRNPGHNLSQSLTRETQIIGDIDQGKGGVAANTGGFVTRQSNKSSSGGGAIYGCRAKAGKEACVAANNLADGDAFRFQVSPNAGEVGLFRFGVNMNTLVNKPPFATNGTGMVKNLNAEKVGGMTAAQLIAAAKGQTGAQGPAGPAGSSSASTPSGSASTGGGGTASYDPHWGMIERNTLGSAFADFRYGPYSLGGVKPPSGIGSLDISVGDANSKVEYGDAVDFNGLKLSSISALSYSLFVGADPNAKVTGVPHVQMEVDPNNAALKDSKGNEINYTTINFLPPTSATDGSHNDTWLDLDAIAADAHWYATGSAGAATACTQAVPTCTWSELVKKLGPDAQVSLSLGIGQGKDNAFHGAVDALRVNGTVYDFEPGGVVDKKP